MPPTSRRSSATGSSGTRSACSTRRIRRWPELNAGAPRIVDRLCDACADHFAGVRAHLDALGIDYRIESGLVRGLDYYTRTAFEFYPRGVDAQQGALGGGGRYDGLVELLGGRPTPGIGFGVGLDRVVNALAAVDAARVASGGSTASHPAGPLAVVVGADPDDTVQRLVLATTLRAAGLAVRAELGRRKLGRQLEGAARDGAHFAVILGAEASDGQVQLRDLQAGSQRHGRRRPTWRGSSSAPARPTSTADRGLDVLGELDDADEVALAVLEPGGPVAGRPGRCRRSSGTRGSRTPRRRSRRRLRLGRPRPRGRRS